MRRKSEHYRRLIRDLKAAQLINAPPAKAANTSGRRKGRHQKSKSMAILLSRTPKHVSKPPPQPPPLPPMLAAKQRREYLHVLGRRRSVKPFNHATWRIRLFHQRRVNSEEPPCSRRTQHRKTAPAPVTFRRARGPRRRLANMMPQRPIPQRPMGFPNHRRRPIPLRRPDEPPMPAPASKPPPPPPLTSGLNREPVGRVFQALERAQQALNASDGRMESLVDQFKRPGALDRLDRLHRVPPPSLTPEPPRVASPTNLADLDSSPSPPPRAPAVDLTSFLQPRKRMRKLTLTQLDFPDPVLLPGPKPNLKPFKLQVQGAGEDVDGFYLYEGHHLGKPGYRIEQSGGRRCAVRWYEPTGEWMIDAMGMFDSPECRAKIRHLGAHPGDIRGNWLLSARKGGKGGPYTETSKIVVRVLEWRDLSQPSPPAPAPTAVPSPPAADASLAAIHAVESLPAVPRAEAPAQKPPAHAKSILRGRPSGRRAHRRGLSSMSGIPMDLAKSLRDAGAPSAPGGRPRRASSERAQTGHSRRTSTLVG